MKVLDIGCGPGDILEYLPDVDYTGFDLNMEYIEAATGRFGSRGKFFCADVNDVSKQDSTYDIVLANGILHHLSDKEAAGLMRLAHSCLSPGGRFVSHDGCFTDSQSAASRYLLRSDRGKYVRTRQGYIDLAKDVFTAVDTYIYDDLLRIPYVHIIMECKR
jgi:cyclopropane fatty-acyl-phospholipid synthase-like methyltransferase